jgi:PD-(D/E)XK nuclease superfamily protein
MRLVTKASHSQPPRMATGGLIRCVADLKTKGDLAEVIGAADLVRRGYKVAIPYGEDWDYDLIVCRDGSLERVQVKYTRSQGSIVVVRCRSASLTNGRVRRVKHYTAEMIDWIAVYDATTDRCYYVPSSEFEKGRSILHLRLTQPRNQQVQRIRWASDYFDLSL